MPSNSIAIINNIIRQEASSATPILPAFPHNQRTIVLSNEALAGLLYLQELFNFTEVSNLLEAIGLFQVEASWPSSTVCQEDGFNDAIEGFPPSFNKLYPGIEKLPPVYYQSYMRGYYEGKYQDRRAVSNKQKRLDRKLEK